MENLFDNPTTLRDPAHFVGRQQTLKRIFSLVQNRQNVALVGGRRIGKTSLLNCLRSPEMQQKLNVDGTNKDGRKLLFLYFDLQRSSMKERVDFFSDILQVLREQIQQLGETLEEGLTKDDELDMLLNLFQEHNIYPVLIMDTFDDIAQYQFIDENLFNFLRYEGSRGKISYIIASVESLWEILGKLLPGGGLASSPFHNIFARIPLSGFEEAEVVEFLRDTSSAGGLPFSQEEIRWVSQLAGKHPFLLQQVATLLFEEKRIHEPGSVNLEQVRKEAQQNLFYYFEDCWAAMDDEARQSVVRVAIQQSREKEVSAAQVDGNYPELCSSKLFCMYLADRGRLQVDVSELPDDELKTILEHFEDRAWLGNCALIGIPSIAARIEQQKAKLPAARGKVVQDALREALKSLEGHGNRTDLASDWTDYNILYYRYFARQRRVSQKIIAKRVAMSQRQYYRIFSEVLHRFWKALRDLDVPTASPS